MPVTRTTEPAEIRAGDTTTWLKTIGDYPPAAGWTLKYSLRNAEQKINITATTVGTDYLVTITAAVSAVYSPGRYDWLAYVVKGSGGSLEQHTVGTGAIIILPNLAGDVVYDARSDARKIYDDLIAKYKELAATGLRVQSYNVAGRSATYNKPAEMLDALKYWASIVRDEENAARVANGGASSRRVGVRMRRI